MADRKSYRGTLTGTTGSSGEKEESDQEESGVGCFTGHLFNMAHIVAFAKYCPLATAILAPLATLMDIPALTVGIAYGRGTEQRD
jgi:hypothetical protein